jgi:hypothetical protein
LRDALKASINPTKEIWRTEMITSFIAIGSVVAGLGCLLAAPILALRSVAPKRTDDTEGDK